ncbi:MAG: ATP-binding protein, partial [Cellulomonas sp.]|nr:ATP-binding protein [Cellulomonas sp.]
RRTAQAARARAEADTLATVAGAVLRGADAVPAMLDQLREAFALAGVALLSRDEAEGPWHVVHTSGDRAPTSPDDASTTVPVREGLVLALQGHALSAEDLRVATAVGLHAEAALERDRLRAEARATKVERERTTMRTALLAAVSHDLRTPLAAIKAGVSALTTSGAAIAPDDRKALLADVETSTDRLQGLIDNLLDMSRLDAGVVSPHRAPVALDEVVPLAVAPLAADRLVIDVPEDLPLIVADAGLLERAVANLVENALRYTTGQVRVVAGALPGAVVIRVVDQGPGVPDERKTAVFAAFQRLGDSPDGHGLGLGLAVAQGFVKANGGTLEAEDTPGGGLTMVITLPVAPV